MKISIILPTYNRAHCIADSINSILAQSFADFELLVIDDCSTDNTEAIVKSINDNRIRYYKLSQNSGVSAARNYGIEHATADLIAFQDSDDEWIPSKLEKQYDFIVKHPEYGMIYTKMECKNINISENYIPNSIVPTEALQGDIFQYLLQANYIGVPTVLVKKEILQSVNCFDTDMPCLEDWDLFLRISQITKIGYIDEPLHIYNIQDMGSVSNKPDYFKARCMLIGKHRNTMLQHNLLTPIMEDILKKAEACNVLEQVGNLLTIYLQY